MDNERQELQRILSTCLLGADISISKGQKSVSTDDIRAAINTYVCSDLSKQSKDRLAVMTGYTLRSSPSNEVSISVVRAAATQARKDSILPYIPACSKKEYDHNLKVMENLCKKVIETYLKEKG